MTIIEEQFKHRWDLCRDGQLLVDASHPLKMYLSVSEDENKQFIIRTPREMKKIKSSSSIKVVNGSRGTQNYLIIELLNPLLTSEFVFLCLDLVERSRTADTEMEALSVLIDSFSKWQQLFEATGRDLLSVREIRGLIGELLFMDSELEGGKAEEDVIAAWKTHRDAARDFVYDDSWYEIKSSSSSSDYVTISSIEQLEHDKDGELVIYFLDRKQDSGPETITLTGIIGQIENRLTTASVLAEFRKKLLTKGYTLHKEYDEIRFENARRNRYVVDDDFPKLHRDKLPDQILNAKYNLSISGIADWLKGE